MGNSCGITLLPLDGTSKRKNGRLIESCPANRSRINIHEEYEVEYWGRELGISPERLRELVGKHGVMAENIRCAVGK
jgi:hypothetical protein